MAGPDSPPSGSRKSKQGDVVAAAVPSSPPTPRPATRSSARVDDVAQPAPPPASTNRKRGDAASAPGTASPPTPRPATRSSARVDDVVHSPAPPASTKRKRGDAASAPGTASPRVDDVVHSATPPESRKRKRGDAASAPGTASPPRPATRSSARMDDAVQWARGAAARTLWMKRGSGHAAEERLREVILDVRRARSILKPDDPHSPYLELKRSKEIYYTPGTRSSERIARQMGPLASHLLSRRRFIGIDPVEYQASVPEWVDAPSEKDTADYKTETLQKLGTVVCPLNMDISATDEADKRKEMVDKCNCSQAGSEACVKVHAKRAMKWLRNQLGKEAFESCGLDEMGERVLKSWTAKDKKKLDDIDELIPQNEHTKFMKIASKQFSPEKTNNLAVYYFNVFLPRRLARFTREGPTNAKDVDTDEDNSKSSGSTSKRSGTRIKRI